MLEHEQFYKIKLTQIISITINQQLKKRQRRVYVNSEET